MNHLLEEVLFELGLEKSTISDNNRVLIDTYIAIRDHLNDLIPLLNELQNEHNSFDDKEKSNEYYYTKRERFNELILGTDFSLERNALFMYLNKACFNGLYRVNASGFFNVPSTQKRKSISLKMITSTKYLNFYRQFRYFTKILRLQYKMLMKVT